MRPVWCRAIVVSSSRPGPRDQRRGWIRRPARWRPAGEAAAEHASARTPTCVSEGAQATTKPGAVSEGDECGGEGGIRTRDGLPRTAFPVRRHSPLGDLSPGADACPKRSDRELAERAGFEPAVLSHTAF